MEAITTILEAATMFAAALPRGLVLGAGSLVLAVAVAAFIAADAVTDNPAVALMRAVGRADRRVAEAEALKRSAVQQARLGVMMLAAAGSPWLFAQLVVIQVAAAVAVAAFIAIHAGVTRMRRNVRKRASI